MKPTLFAVALIGILGMPAFAADKAENSAKAMPAKTDSALPRILALKGDAVKGKDAYQICRGCHRADASGKAEAEYPQLAGQHPAVIIKQMVDVREGRRDSPKMHPFIAGDVVPEQDIADIAAYLYALPVPTNNGKGSGRGLDLGKHLYVRDCAVCHGKQGEGVGAKFYPRVAGQHYAYLYRESRESRDKGRRNSNADMVRLIRHYTDDDLRVVSDYMSRLVPSKR